MWCMLLCLLQPSGQGLVLRKSGAHGRDLKGTARSSHGFSWHACKQKRVPHVIKRQLRSCGDEDIVHPVAFRPGRAVLLGFFFWAWKLKMLVLDDENICCRAACCCGWA